MAKTERHGIDSIEVGMEDDSVTVTLIRRDGVKMDLLLDVGQAAELAMTILEFVGPKAQA